MATNLWTDVDALARLARSARTAEAGPWTARRAVAPDPAEELLPCSHRDGFELATDERPARVVSGDLLDAFPLGRRRLAFMIGDVSGKGAPAGVLGAFTRSLVRHVAPRSPTPGETLTRVNSILAGARLDAIYVTIFLGVLDRSTGRLAYANAGHPPALLARAAAAKRPAHPTTAVFGAATGPILGILDRIAFGSGTLQLREGDTMLLYTDGVTEARNARGRFFGPE
ncbi:MAG TPA: PP2C family protein-serine/threonine phosphatase, partial [Candidatus Polarisedimenticolia bacterium]|nr:PP2C family protein-serine/threonine phosphatase [Candidatus Polarisedimenticolia bacterium]